MLGIFKKTPVPSSPLPLFLYNSAAQQKAAFTPLKAPYVSMYTCGPTVYDYAHIGNLRAFLMADTLKRVLIYNRYKVEHTMNFTDFGHLTDDADAGEDKMMKGLKRDGKPITLNAMRELADTYIEAFLADAAAIRMLEPSHWTRASDYVRQQIALIKTLVEKGYAYETSDGLYFDIAKFPTYGVLGNIDITKMKEGARVEVNPEKRHPADFALWKKGLLGWESDWGKGFPGWHIECSAMAMATLGKQLDIHTGGEDNKYTHHNAEIAQSEAATGKPFVQYWLHSAFMQIDNTKISKSLGNSISLRNLIDRGFTGTDYRYWILTAHYRSNINFTFESLEGAKKALFRLKRHLFEEYKNAKGSIEASYEARFHEAINDDLNTPKAIAVMWDMVGDKSISAGDKAATLRHFDSVLGLGLNDRAEDVRRELGVVPQASIPADVEELLNQREAARAIRNWEEADRLRQAINLKGYTIEDGPDGPRLSKV